MVKKQRHPLLKKGHRTKFMRWEKGGLKEHLEYIESEWDKERYKIEARKKYRLEVKKRLGVIEE